MGKEAANQTTQHERFIETARALEFDEDEQAFREKLGKIAKAKPKDPKPESSHKLIGGTPKPQIFRSE